MPSTKPSTTKPSTKPAKKAPAKKAPEAPKAPRRSHSLFTSPGDAMLFAASRPLTIAQEIVTVRVNRKNVPQLRFFLVDKATREHTAHNPAGGYKSRSAARRGMYKAETEQGFSVSARALASARAKREKQRNGK